MSFRIVPNYVSDAIYEKIDAEIEKTPGSEPHRELFYSQLLNYFDEHGKIPEFSIENKSDKEQAPLLDDES